MNNTPYQLYLEIFRQGERHAGRLHLGDSDTGQELPKLDIGPKITLPGSKLTLELCVKRMMALDVDFIKHAFDIRWQLNIGEYLYDQTIGQFAQEGQSSNANNVELFILTEDSWTASLPWMLLAQKGIFLTSRGWSISQGWPQAKRTARELPDNPRMLVTIPEPNKHPTTDSEAHYEDLRTPLMAVNPYFTTEHNLRWVKTWASFQRQLQSFRPHVVYFYGHGNQHATHLIFETENQEPHPVLMADFISHICPPGEWQPLLVYINCCQGDTTGRDSHQYRIGRG